MQPTYLFYDLETSGLNKAFDQIVQFAAIRTDSNLNELERYEYFVRLNKDVVPSPEAFITHRIAPSRLATGMSEYEAVKCIHDLFNTPSTISIGYNSLRFDDEFLRFSFYRNLLPPYLHQYANNCGRMDLYPITVIYSLFKKHLLKWPADNLKLENISKLNGLVDGMAHNAMVDVTATLRLAKCFKEDSSTWNYLSGFFNKQVDNARCQKIMHTKNEMPLGILFDGKFGHHQQYQTAVIALGEHHHYKNQSLWLRLDSENLLHTTVNNFQENTWVINKKIGEPGIILPMKDRFVLANLAIKMPEINDAISWVKNNSTLLEMISRHYRTFIYPKIPDIDVDASIYEKGFPSPHDQEVCRRFHLAPPEKKLSFMKSLSDPHLQKLLVRIAGRHFADYLSNVAREDFNAHLNLIRSQEQHCLDHKGNPRLKPHQALQQIDELWQQPLDDEQRQILTELKRYILKHFFNNA